MKNLHGNYTNVLFRILCLKKPYVFVGMSNFNKYGCMMHTTLLELKFSEKSNFLKNY
jgi:hypothetical protein